MQDTIDLSFKNVIFDIFQRVFRKQVLDNLSIKFSLEHVLVISMFVVSDVLIDRLTDNERLYGYVDSLRI